MKRLLYKGEPVVTFKMIDELHGRPADTARGTFTRNKGRFKEAIHYIKTSDECLTEEIEGNNKLLTINNDQDGCSTPMSGGGTKAVVAADSLKYEKILLTEKGYLLLVKPFTDELSWQVQDALIDDYFRTKDQLRLNNNDSGQRLQPAIVEERVLFIWDYFSLKGLPKEFLPKTKTVLKRTKHEIRA